MTVAITALGTLGAAGSLTRVDRGGGYHRDGGSTEAALVGELDLRRWIRPLAMRRMSLPSRYAVAAARMALDDAEQAHCGVAMATSYGPAAHTQRILDQLFAEGPQAVSPALFTECVANAAAAQMAIQLGLRGPNHTIAGREDAALAAVGCGAAEIRAGRAPRMLVGAVEEMTPLLHASLDRFGALTPRVARPFDRDRDGFVAAEGATVLALEATDAALARGTSILAELRAWGGCNDPSAGRVGWGSGYDRVAASIARSLARAGIELETIDLVISGASGSRGGDRMEAKMLRSLWGARPLPPVVAPKGLTGEYGGGFLAASLSYLGDRPLPGDVGFQSVDPELDLTPVRAASVAVGGRALVTDAASGGSVSWLVLERR